MAGARRKKPMKKSTIIKIVIVLFVLLAGGTLLVRGLRSRVAEQFGSDDEDEILTAEVTTGSISTTVSGSGTLTNQESEDTYISGTVDVTEIYVSAGDNVEKGDMLASVNSVSVVNAMKEVQDKIDALDEEIEALEDEDVSDTITAGVDGRVKLVYVESGDNVSDVMYEHNSLILLSTDGYMAVDIAADQLSEGDTVTVRDSVGDDYTGTVETTWAGTATIVVGDSYIAYEEQVTVFDENGNQLGGGAAYIHEQVSVTGFSGTVDSVYVSENDYVYAGNTLLTIDDVTNTINYAALLEERAELEEELQELIVIYKEGAVYAQKKGMVTAISETEDSTTTTTTAESGNRGGNSGTVTTVTEDSSGEDGTTISICPTDTMSVAFTVDETDVLSLKVGQTAEVTISSLGEDTYEGTITEMDTVGSSSDGVTTYTATLTLDKADGMLEGMTASVVTTIEGKENALLLPVDAVHMTSSSYYVYTSYDEENKEFGGMTEITAGIANSEYIEISDGLAEGDTVYYSSTTEEDDRGGMNMGGPNGGGGNMPGGGGENRDRNRSGNGGNSGGGAPGQR